MSFSGHRLPLVFLDLSGIGHQEDKKKIIWDNIFVPVEWGVFGNLLIVIFFWILCSELYINQRIKPSRNQFFMCTSDEFYSIQTYWNEMFPTRRGVGLSLHVEKVDDLEAINNYRLISFWFVWGDFNWILTKTDKDRNSFFTTIHSVAEISELSIVYYKW